MLNGLLEYHRIHQSFAVPRDVLWDDRSLYEWTRNQRKHYLNGLRGKKPALLPARAERLSAIGFDLNPTDALKENDALYDRRWASMFDGLAAFKQKHGHCVVPTGFQHDGRSLTDWIRQQRKQYSNALEGIRPALSKERTERLQSIGFELDPTGRRQDKRSEQERWEVMFHGLVDFYKNNGTFLLSAGYFHDGRSLFSWAHNQLRLYSNYLKGVKPALTHERAELLRGIGFIAARLIDMPPAEDYQDSSNLQEEQGSPNRRRGNLKRPRYSDDKDDDSDVEPVPLNHPHNREANAVLEASSLAQNALTKYQYQRSTTQHRQSGNNNAMYYDSEETESE